MNFLKNKTFLIFVAKFFATFLICYYVTLGVIGISAEGGMYNGFISKNLNYIDWIRSSLLAGTKFILKIFGTETYLNNKYNIKQINGRGIVIVYQCVGYGIMSFWTAFIVALQGKFSKKIVWWFIGIITFWIINVIRLALLLVATNKNWSFPFGWDHHTWFSIVAYSFMLYFIYLFDKKSDAAALPNNKQPNN